jgi:hypothetical protein
MGFVNGKGPAKVVGGMLMTIVGIGFFIFGGTIPMILGGPTIMVLGFMIMVLGGYITYKGWTTKELVGITPEGEKLYR